jgi:hypothetical protein
MVPGSARNWIAVNALIGSSMNRRKQIWNATIQNAGFTQRAALLFCENCVVKPEFAGC